LLDIDETFRDPETWGERYRTDIWKNRIAGRGGDLIATAWGWNEEESRKRANSIIAALAVTED
jgi:hypothetical protein